MDTHISFKILLKSSFVTLIAMAVIVVIFSGIFYLFPIQTNTLTIFGNIAIALSLFCGGIVTARSCKRHILLHGIALAIIFIIVLLTLTLVWGEPKLWILMQKTALIIIGSILGAIIGVE